MSNDYTNIAPVRHRIELDNINVDMFIRLWYQANQKYFSPLVHEATSEEQIFNLILTHIQKIASIDISEIVNSPNYEAMLVEAIHVVYDTDPENTEYPPEFKSMFCFTKQNFIVAKGNIEYYTEMVSSIIDGNHEEVSKYIDLVTVTGDETLFLILICRLCLTLS